MLNESERSAADKAATLFDRATGAYQNALKVYTKTDLPEGWAVIQLNMTELDLTAGRFSTCLQQVAVLDGDALPPPRLIIRDVMKLACQWGHKDLSATAATEKALASRPAALEKGWDLTGTIVFLSNSPAFAAGRTSWIALFTSLQTADAPGMTTALRQLEPILQQ